jgi:ATP-dependent DNA helicase RecG
MILSDQEIEDLITAGESDRVECKESFADKDRVCEAICAFANDLPNRGLPGIVVIGVQDDPRIPSGISITDLLLRELADMRDNGKILPFPSMVVERRLFLGAEIAVVTVEPSASPPVQFRGRTWIRVGSRRAIATPEEEARLVERRRQANLPFDAQPLPSAGIDDLDVDRFLTEILPQLVAPDVLAANQRSPEHQLGALHFIDPDGRATPTGVLFAGRDPLFHLPGAYVQFLRFDGTGLADPVRSEHRITGVLPQVISEVEEVIRANIDTSVDIVGQAVESRRPSVSFDALQQLVRNASMHRIYQGTNAPTRITWFDDRVEIQSPGGPFGRVTVENFGTEGAVDYRNPTIAAVLSQLGYVQQFGVGIEIARQRLEANGNPPLELEATVTAVNATVRLLK